MTSRQFPCSKPIHCHTLPSKLCDWASDFAPTCAEHIRSAAVEIVPASYSYQLCLSFARVAVCANLFLRSLYARVPTRSQSSKISI